MRGILIISALLLTVSSCKKVVLDSLAFPSEKLETYQFENYPNPEIELPAAYSLAPLQQHLIPLTSVDQATGETYTIYGLYIGDTATISSDSIIYYLHGQSKHMDNYWTRAALLANVGGAYNYGVFMIDYRGYGRSEGSSTELGLIEDADAGIDWLISKGADKTKTIFYGYSLGAIPAINRSAYRTDFIPAKLICESPLASVEYLAQSSVLLNVDGDFVTTLKFNNAETIKEVQIPYLWLHGIQDDYVSIDNGELIFANYNGPYGEPHRIEDSGHSEVPIKMGVSNYLSGVLKFIQK